LRFIHLFSTVTWFGGVIFLSAFVAPVMFTTFPVEQAGDVMGAIFPVFYRMSYAAGLLSLVSLYFAFKKRPWIRIALILIMLLASLYGGEVVGKKAAELRLMIRQEASVERKAELKENFHSQHRLSMISNSVVLILIPVVLFLTARKLGDG